MAPEEVAERLQNLPCGATAPLNVHLRQEVDRLNIVMRIARETLESLRLAIAGGFAPASLSATSAGCLILKQTLTNTTLKRVLHADPCCALGAVDRDAPEQAPVIKCTFDVSNGDVQARMR